MLGVTDGMNEPHAEPSCSSVTHVRPDPDRPFSSTTQLNGGSLNAYA